MPTKFMLLHFLAALYICNGIAAGDLEFGETLFNHYRVALHRRDIVSISESSGCPSDSVPCPTGGGCCPLVSQCSFNSKGQGTCNIPCGPGSFTCAGACCQEGTTCSGTLCVISSDEVLLTTLSEGALPTSIIPIDTTSFVLSTATFGISALPFTIPTASETSTTNFGVSTLPTFIIPTTSETPTTDFGVSTLPTFIIPTTNETSITTSNASTPTNYTQPGPASSSSTSTPPLERAGIGSIAFIPTSSVISFAVIAVFGIFHFS